MFYTFTYFCSEIKHFNKIFQHAVLCIEWYYTGFFLISYQFLKIKLFRGYLMKYNFN